LIMRSVRFQPSFLQVLKWLSNPTSVENVVAQWNRLHWID
jgi:hypothetical protein